MVTTEVLITNEFRAWFESLALDAQNSVARVVTMLEELGVTLPHPYSTSILGSRLAMRELRVQHMGEPYRVLYVFDPMRRAVLLVGGSKLGSGNRWYAAAIREAEKLYARYLRDIEET